MLATFSAQAAWARTPDRRSRRLDVDALFRRVTNTRQQPSESQVSYE